MNCKDLSYDILLKINTKLQNESKIFHKVMENEEFTKEDVVAYANAQVQTKKDEVELYTSLLNDYLEQDYMPDVRKIQTFENIIEGAKLNIDFYTLMAKEFEN